VDVVLRRRSHEPSTNSLPLRVPLCEQALLPTQLSSEIDSKKETDTNLHVTAELRSIEFDIASAYWASFSWRMTRAAAPRQRANAGRYLAA